MTTVVAYDDFSRGEFGDLGPRLPADAGPGWFTGKNVMKYRGGAVGPRPGLKGFTVTGGTLPDGKVRTMYGSVAADEEVFLVIGTVGRQLDPNLSAMELAIVGDFNDDTIPASTGWPTNGQHRTTGNWVIVPGVGLYRANIDLDTVSLVDTNLEGRAFKFYKDRQLAADDSEVYYSGPGTGGWDTFADFFTGTSFNPVTGFFELRNGIVVAQSSPNLDLVTGTIGTSSAVLRRITTRTGPLDPYACASIGGEFLVMMGRSLRYPTLYNGATWEELRHLPYAGASGGQQSASDRPAHSVYDLETGQSWMILSGIVASGATNRMLLDWDGCRTYHTFEATVAPYARRFENGVVALTDGGNTSDPPVFYAWYPDLDRPAFTSDTYSRPGDLSDTPHDTYLHLPAWQAPDGQECMVRELVVDYRKWNTGSASTNHFDVTVDARARYGNGILGTSGAQTFDEAGSSAATSGQDGRAHLYLGDQGWGGEFQVKLDDLRGVAIRSVVAVVETRPTR